MSPRFILRCMSPIRFYTKRTGRAIKVFNLQLLNLVSDVGWGVQVVRGVVRSDRVRVDDTASLLAHSTYTEQRGSAEKGLSTLEEVPNGVDVSRRRGSVWEGPSGVGHWLLRPFLLFPVR